MKPKFEANWKVKQVKPDETKGFKKVDIVVTWFQVDIENKKVDIVVTWFQVDIENRKVDIVVTWLQVDIVVTWLQVDSSNLVETKLEGTVYCGR
ncbi:hypothetical protein AMTRI_Chr11g151440 [Amborella trichopoda]